MGGGGGCCCLRVVWSSTLVLFLLVLGVLWILLLLLLVELLLLRCVLLDGPSLRSSLHSGRTDVMRCGGGRRKRIRADGGGKAE